MKEKQHDLCEGCLAFQEWGFSPHTKRLCELGYALANRHTGNNTYMPGPAEPCPRPCQKRTLHSATVELRESGKRVMAVHHKEPTCFILVKKTAVAGKDYPDWYKVTS